ncbi:MAG: OmpA family protein [Planctomycetota bacterium]|nr:OmpA family protein [Planctomycetota bacterium]
MKPRAHPKEEKGEKAPLWILSFGDMVTNFMAFFILMQTFATTQKSEFLQTGEVQGSLMVAGSGSPSWLYGRRPGLGREFGQNKYAVEGDPESVAPERIIDPDDDMLRKAFDDIRRESDTQATDSPVGRTRILVTPIRFASGQTSLDAAATDYLAGVVAELEQIARDSRRCIYVVGAAQDAASPRDQLLLSARRAQAVRDVLAQKLSPEVAGGGARLSSWGIGAGRQGLVGAESHPPDIVIAVQESSGQE